MKGLKDLMPGPVKYFRLEFTDESPEDVEKILAAYETFLESGDLLFLEDITFGRFFKGVE
jgi:hypothetical protein